MAIGLFVFAISTTLDPAVLAARAEAFRRRICIGADTRHDDTTSLRRLPTSRTCGTASR